MAKWRAAAIERLPEFRQIITDADNLMALWIELEMAFERAYQGSRDESLIARIYSFADWCGNAPRGHDAGDDASTALVVGFYEHIPSIPAARDDMPRWFRRSEVVENKQIFAYLIGEEAYGRLIQYMAKNERLYKPRTWPIGAS